MNYNQLKLAIYTTYIQVDNSNIFSGPNHFIPYTQQINTFLVFQNQILVSKLKCMAF